MENTKHMQSKYKWTARTDLMGTHRHFFPAFKKNVLMWKSHIKLTTLKWTIQWHWSIYNVMQTSPLSSSKTFNHPKQKPHTHLTSHSPPLLVCVLCLWIYVVCIFHINGIIHCDLLFLASTSHDVLEVSGDILTWLHFCSAERVKPSHRAPGTGAAPKDPIRQGSK